jgi:hypothetical protein
LGIHEKKPVLRANISFRAGWFRAGRFRGGKIRAGFKFPVRAPTLPIPVV